LDLLVKVFLWKNWFYSCQLPGERKVDLLRSLAEFSPFTTPQDSRQILPSIVQLLKVNISWVMAWSDGLLAVMLWQHQFCLLCSSLCCYLDVEHCELAKSRIFMWLTWLSLTLTYIFLMKWMLLRREDLSCKVWVVN
jgi:hypothetical protein